jgi:hypothetical protein
LRVVPLGVGGPPTGISFSGELAETAGMVAGVPLAGAKPLGQRASRPLRGRAIGGPCNAQDARCPSNAKRGGGSLGEGVTCDPTMRSQQVATLPVSGRAAAR